MQVLRAADVFFYESCCPAHSSVCIVQRVSCISYDRFRPSVSLSVCPSQSGIMSKRLKLRSWSLHC